MGSIPSRERHPRPSAATGYPDPNATRTAVCYARPEREELAELFAWAAATKVRFGLVNGQALSSTHPGSRALTRTSSCTGNRSPAPNLEVEFAGLGLGDESFEAARLIGRSVYRETLPNVPHISSAWNLQRSFLHLAGVGVRTAIRRARRTERSKPKACLPHGRVSRSRRGRRSTLNATRRLRI
jgi:hypothetical protein